jgi:hypothetical protein
VSIISKNKKQLIIAFLSKNGMLVSKLILFETNLLKLINLSYSYFKLIDGMLMRVSLDNGLFCLE